MQLLITGPRAVLSSRATPRLLAVLPRLEGRRTWIKAGGLSLDASAHNVEVLREAFPDLVVSATERHDGGQFDLPATPVHYAPKTVPYDHQTRALAKIENLDQSALFMEQGTGKTWVAITKAGKLWAAGKISGVLVIGKNGVHRQWIAQQIPAHFGGPWEGAYYENNKRRWSEEARGGSGERPLVWRSINYDGAKASTGHQLCLDFVRAHSGRVLIVADETQDIKSAQSARHKAIQKIKIASQSPYRIALTGTPIAVDLCDEWAQLKWLNEDILGIRYVTSFRNEYCIMGGFEGRKVIAHKNMERFRERVDPFTFRATKDELGILPKSYRRWAFDLTPEQKCAIQELKDDLRHQIATGELCTVDNAAVKLLKIQQASNGFIVDEDGNAFDLVPDAKNPRLLSLLEVLSAYEGKTIVWAKFRKDIEAISRALKASKVSHVEYHGGTGEKDRQAAVESFMDEGGARVFLSNPQAGGTGLNLQGICRHAIYYSNGFNAIDRWQSEDRIHRIGTNGSVSYTDLFAKGGIDGLILSNLKRKKGLSELAIGEIKRYLDGDWEYEAE